MGSTGREGYGRVGREAAAAVDSVAVLVDRFDPELTGARDVLDLLEVFSRLEHLASAGVALAAGRVAQTDLWKRGGFHSAARWLDHVTGMGVGEAVRLLQAAEAVEAAPDTLDALKAGKVSTRQAKAIGAAEAVDPAAGQHLLSAIEHKSTKETETDAARVVAAASTESPEAKAERHRKARRVHHGVNADGMGYGSWLLPIAEHTRIVAHLDGERAKVFDQARTDGVRESADAYTAVAFCRVFDRAARRGHQRPKADDTGADGADSADAVAPGEVVEDWSFAKLIVRVDLGALDRGQVAPGEVCEIAGHGPIPVADAWRMIDGAAFVAAVTTKGTEIDKVIHLGRQPTVLQKTALEWFSAAACSTEGCTSPARIEIDHVADWADTHITTLPDLASPCGHCHDLKTHHGHTFGPRLPSGRRRLIPPDQSPPGGLDPPGNSPPRDPDPPGLTLLPGNTDPEPPPDVTTQGDLFDTG